MATSDSHSGRCASCGAPIPRNAPFGQCPRCLLALGRGMMLAAGPDEELLDAGQVRNFGEYELLEEIARGGMGVVYRARQVRLGREVAVKMILAGALATTDAVLRFRNEAAAAARLDHPNIVSVYEIGEHETQHYFSMRLVLGRQNVATWAKSLAPPAAIQIAEMMAKVARAVAFAHERGVLHRDLKPSNILVDEKGEPQVTDFGLAKVISEANSGLTPSAEMLGSPSYMAPEQADARHRDVTTAADVYGLGAVLYELLAGGPPFEGKSHLDTARMVVEQMPAPLADAPRDLATVVMKCLAKEPAQRYATALALAEDLELFARGEPIRARRVTAPEALWRWAKRRPKIAALLAALLMTLLVGISGVLWQWRRAERSVAHLEWMEMARQAGTDEAPVALARLAALLREDPTRWQTAMLAMSVVDQRPRPMLVGKPVVPDAKLIAPPRLVPDGSWFAAAAADRSVRVWDSASGRERARIALAEPASGIAVSDGPIALAIATQDGRITVRATIDGPTATLPRGSNEPIDEMYFSADGSRLIARSRDFLHVWKCDAHGAPIMVTMGEEIRGSAVSADGNRVLLWSGKRAAVYDMSSGDLLIEVAAQRDFRQGAFAADGKRLALIDGAYFALVWDVKSEALPTRIESPLMQFRFLALNASGTRLMLGGLSNELSVYDTASGLAISPRMQHFYEPTALTSSADGRRVASFGMDGRGCVWDAESGEPVQSAIWLNTVRPAAMSLSRDGKTMLLFPESMMEGSPTISVWWSVSASAAQPKHLDGQRNFTANRLSPDGRLGCLSLADDFRAYLYELATDRVVLNAPTNGSVGGHHFSPDMRRYYAVTMNGWLHGWSLETGEPLWPPVPVSGAMRVSAISPDGTRMIVGQSDGVLRIHDTANGQLVRTLDHAGVMKVLRFAPDGSGRFLSASNDGSARIWDLETGHARVAIQAHAEAISAAAWSPDARTIATASYDQTARVWDAETGRAMGRPMAHLAWLAHLEFSPDGRLLATACRDGTARLWHPRTGQPASPLLALKSSGHTVHFTPDGKCLFVRDHLGFSFWDTERFEPLSVHYPAAIGGGLGADTADLRAMISRDGTRVHLGASMTETTLWNIPQPRTAVPDWFPDFLENLALIRLDATGTPRVSSGEGLFQVKERLSKAGEEGPYAVWARRVLGLDAKR